MSDFRQVLGNVIREARKDKGLTQAVLSERVGITARQLMLIEKSKSNPSFDTLFALIQVLNIPADRIFHPEDQPLDQEVQELMRAFRVCEPGERKIVAAAVRGMVAEMQEQRGQD